MAAVHHAWIFPRISERVLKLETCQSLSGFAKEPCVFYVFIPTLLFEALLRAVLLSLSLSLIYFLFPVERNFSEFADHRVSHILPLYPQDQSTLCIVALSGLPHPSPFFDVIFTTVSQETCFPCSQKVSANASRRPQKGSREESIFIFVNSYLFPTLIGPLATAGRAINKTIQLER